MFPPGPSEEESEERLASPSVARSHPVPAAAERRGLPRERANRLAQNAMEAEIVMLGMCEALPPGRIGVLQSPYGDVREVRKASFRVLRWLSGPGTNLPERADVIFAGAPRRDACPANGDGPASRSCAPFREQDLHDRFGESFDWGDVFGGPEIKFFFGESADAGEIHLLFLSRSPDPFLRAGTFVPDAGRAFPTNALFHLDGASLSDELPERRTLAESVADDRLDLLREALLPYASLGSVVAERDAGDLLAYGSLEVGRKDRSDLWKEACLLMMTAALDDHGGAADEAAKFFAGCMDRTNGPAAGIAVLGLARRHVDASSPREAESLAARAQRMALDANQTVENRLAALYALRELAIFLGEAAENPALFLRARKDSVLSGLCRTARAIADDSTTEPILKSFAARLLDEFRPAEEGLAEPASGPIDPSSGTIHRLRPGGEAW